MFEGYRSKIGAAGLIFAIALATLSAFWLIENGASLHQRYEKSAKDRAEDYAERRDVIIEDRCTPLPPQEKAVCINQERESARQGYRDEYDLEAQRVTANWTAQMGIAAIIGMAASLIGVGLVFFTFRETQRTARIAQENLDSYRDLESGRLVPMLEFNSDAKISVKIKNVGKSDVTVIHADVCLLKFNKEIISKIPTKLSNDLRPQNIAISPDKFYPFEHIANPSDGIYTIAGGAIYMDIFGRVRLCPIAIDVIFPECTSFSSGNVDFTKWKKAALDLQAGKAVSPSKE